MLMTHQPWQPVRWVWHGVRTDNQCLKKDDDDSCTILAPSALAQRGRASRQRSSTGDEYFTVRAGPLAFVPRGVPHIYANLSGAQLIKASCRGPTRDRFIHMTIWPSQWRAPGSAFDSASMMTRACLLGLSGRVLP
jgi:hypothetical protein